MNWDEAKVTGMFGCKPHVTSDDHRVVGDDHEKHLTIAGGDIERYETAHRNGIRPEWHLVSV
jgi:hypothetical protein